MIIRCLSRYDEKNKPSWLRIYAIKLDSNVYVVTGGAIKLTQKMDRPHLMAELKKQERCKKWLKEQGVYDQDGLQEVI